VGDWNGDGLEDLAYQGLCGGDAHDCWRVQLSTGSSFSGPSDWGITPTGPVAALPIDLSGDGRDDLVYRSECERHTCWFGQMSSGSGFDEPLDLGPVTEAENTALQPFDFDGNGTTDLVAWSTDGHRSTIEVRFGTPQGLSPAKVLARLELAVREVYLERSSPGAPAQASIRFDCDQEEICMEHLFAVSSQELGDSDHYRSELLLKQGLPEIS